MVCPNIPIVRQSLITVASVLIVYETEIEIAFPETMLQIICDEAHSAISEIES